VRRELFIDRPFDMDECSRVAISTREDKLNIRVFHRNALSANCKSERCSREEEKSDAWPALHQISAAVRSCGP
jgi:hypothetical protein